MTKAALAAPVVISVTVVIRVTGATRVSGAARLAAGPLVGRLRGSQLARRELARAIYQPSLASRIWARVLKWLESLVPHTASGSPSWPAVVLFGIGVLALLAAVGRVARSASLDRRYRGAVVEDRPRSAAQHRSAADGFAAAGDYKSAIIERVRAIAAELESRHILPPRPGRTAAELGAETALAIPAEATALGDATRLFDDVRYGDRPGSQAGYQQVRDLDLRIQAVPIQVSGTR